MTLPPREVFLEVTAHCNIKCPMCPVTTGLERPRGTMKYELFEKVLDDVAGIVPHMSLFLAGEPLLHKRIFEMIAAASQRGIFTRIHTNALLLNEAEDSGRSSTAGSTSSRSASTARPRSATTGCASRATTSKCIELIKRVQQVKRERGSAKPFTRIQIIYFQGEDPAEQRREMEDIFQENLPDELSVVPAHSWAGEYQEFVRYRDNVGDLVEAVDLPHAVGPDGDHLGRQCGRLLQRFPGEAHQRQRERAAGARGVELAGLPGAAPPRVEEGLREPRRVQRLRRAMGRRRAEKPVAKGGAQDPVDRGSRRGEDLRRDGARQVSTPDERWAFARGTTLLPTRSCVATTAIPAGISRAARRICCTPCVRFAMRACSISAPAADVCFPALRAWRAG